MRQMVMAGMVLMTVNVILLMSLLGLVIHKYTKSPAPRIAHSLQTGTTTVVEKQLFRMKRRLQSDNYRWAIDAIYQNESNMEKPAIHCLIHPAFKSADTQRVLRWNCDDKTFSDKLLTTADGTFTVTLWGYYYVYSQVLYHGKGTEEQDYEHGIHIALKLKDDNPTILMKNTNSTPTFRHGHLGYSTISLGGTFFLEPNSRIYVMSNIPSNIDTAQSPYATYFGPFLV